jgi:hypothetical protein
MINAPDPGRKVAVYADEQGRRYSLDTLTNQVVEIDARSASDGIAGDAQALTQSELEAIAMHYVEAVLPDFADVQSDLQYEPGQKGTFYFFSWYAVMQPGQMNRPFIQIGLHESGALFAYYNTVLLAE